MLYVGIDPGANGALVAMNDALLIVDCLKLAKTDTRGINAWLRRNTPTPDGNHYFFGALERQTARPTLVYDKELRAFRWRILKSTCQLYGSYTELSALLVANDCTFIEVLPAAWQKQLGIAPRTKGESEGQWKARLVVKAQALHPRVRVTKATADAILLAHYLFTLYGRGTTSPRKKGRHNVKAQD